MKVAGLSIQDIMDIDIKDFNRLNERDLRDLTKRLSSAANKRIKRMETGGDLSPAYDRIMESGGKISVKDKSFNQLRQEFGRARDFLQSKTSSIKGWKSTKKKVIDEFKKLGVDIPEDKYNDVFRTYEKVKERNPEVGMRSLKYRVMKKIVSGAVDYEDLILEAQEELEDLYLEAVSWEDVAEDVSGFFERGTI